MTETATSAKDCSTCRYASTEKRPKVMSETGFGDQLMFEDADKDETHYTCRAFVSEAEARVGFEGVPYSTSRGEPAALCAHAGKEIGVVPITCAAYEAPPKRDLSALDQMIARRERERSERGGR